MKKVYIVEDLCDSIIIGVYDTYAKALKASVEYSLGCMITKDEVADFLKHEIHIKEVSVE